MEIRRVITEEHYDGMLGYERIYGHLRPSGAPHHLQYISHWTVHISSNLPVKIFGSFHHHQMTRQIHPPC